MQYNFQKAIIMNILRILPFLFLLTIVEGQIPRPVKWTTDVEKISDEEYELIFTATMDDGWTIYSQFLEDGGPIPTNFFFKESPHYELIGQANEEGKKKEGYDDLFEMNVVKFSEKAVFRQRLKVLDNSLPIEGDIEYMTCDDTRCLPPVQEPFSIDLDANPDRELAEEALKITTPESPELQTERKTPVLWSGQLIEKENGVYQIQLLADIQEGWYIYSQYLEDESGPIPTDISFEATEAFELQGKVEESSPGKVEEFDNTFEMQLIKLKKSATFTQTIKRLDAKTEILQGEVYYMVCDKSRCMPPAALDIKVDFINKEVLVGKEATAEATQELIQDDEALANIFGISKPNLDNPKGSCTTEAIIETSSSNWSIFVLGFLGGLVALLTPCIFPMIPLTVSFFTKGSGSSKKNKGFSQAFLYGFFILLIYVLLSVPFHLLDSIDSGILNSISTNPWLNLVFFAIFVFFAFSFFGYYELTLPEKWANRASGAESLGGILGIFFMALTLALVSFSCTGPILGSLLAGALTADGGAWQLTSGMTGFGLALALPFALFAAFPSWMTSLPKSGGWLNSVKVILGFVELALALKFLSNADMVKHWGLLKIEPFLILWILIAIGMGLYMFGKIKFPHDSPIKKLSATRIVLGVAFWGFAVYMMSGFRYDEKAQSYQSLTLLSGIAPPVCYSWFMPCDCPQNLNCFKDLKEGITYAKEANQPVMIDFTGYACFNCRKMEELVWPKESVYQQLRDDYVLISLYVDDRKPLPEDEQIPVIDYMGRYDTLKTYGEKWTHLQFTYFNNVSQPYYALISPDGKLLNNPVGYTPDESEYAAFLSCGTETFKKLSAKKENNRISEK